jgi:purine-nucleoside phosphorylase
MTAVVLTNAAGGIRSDLRPGSFMLIESHLKLLSPDAWRTASYPHHPYSQRLLQQFRHHAHDFNPPMAVGCYAAVTGPSYETAAEIRALRAIGADAVGMSTAIEAEVAAEVGLEVAAISCITNWAAGLSVQPLSHSEVEVTARQAVNRMTELLRHFVPAI